MPTFTWCFLHAVLAEILVVFFASMLPVILIQLRTRDETQRPLLWDGLAASMYILTTLLLCDRLFLLLHSFYEFYIKNLSVPLVEFLYPAMQFITLV